MRNQFTIFLTVPLLAGALIASPVEEDMAVSAAEGWIAAQGELSGHVVDSWEPRISEGQTTAWLFQLQPGGFLLLSADDAARPVVGWSAVDDAPPGVDHPAVTAYLEAVDQEILQARQVSLEDAGNRAEWMSVVAGTWTTPSRTVIVQPLLSCTWDQGAGWNDLCPPDALGPGGRALTGCVAVCMVQVMHYWNQPRTGVGSHGYMSDYGWLEADFGAAEYDWDAMSDNSPTYEAAEVMYHAGVAVDMGYGPTGSGAYVGWGYPSAFTAMTEHFRFTSAAQFEEREDYSNAQWRALVADELAAGRPMIYRGYGTGGHAFNVDGFRDDDYFHFNWGWSGSYNGWFLLDSLTPGGSNFNEGQAVIMGLVPESHQHAPVAIGPLSGALSVPCSPAEFSWSASEGADSYEFMLDDAPGFSFPDLHIEGLTETSFTTADLAHYSTYYWRVRAHGDLGWSPWSSVCEFETEYWETTPAPSLATPMNGAQQVNVDPTVFVWAFVDGAESYGVQVSPQSDFSTLLVDESGIEEHYLLLNDVLAMDESYFWRVNCHGLAGLSEWSEVRELRTETAVSLVDSQQPTTWSLGEAWPNPFNPETRISLTLSRAADVELRVFDLGGRLVEELRQGWMTAGQHDLAWKPASAAAGIYLLEARIEGRRQLRRVTLLK